MTGPEPEDNYQRIEDLEEENHSLREELTRIQTENDRLREEVKKREKLLRGKARSAPPFSKGKRKAHPKRPGRKPEVFLVERVRKREQRTVDCQVQALNEVEDDSGKQACCSQEHGDHPELYSRLRLLALRRLR